MGNITVVDIAGASGTAIINPDSFTEVVTPWFEEVPEEFAGAVAEAITALADLVTEPTWAPEMDELTEFLGISITR